MRLPAKVLPGAVLPLSAMPAPLLPEMTLPGGWPGTVASPPTRLFAVLCMKTPTPLLPRSTVPVTSVPMKLPCTVLPPLKRRTPSLALPLRRLRAAAVVPPTRVFVAPPTLTPVAPLPRSRVPLLSVPM